MLFDNAKDLLDEFKQFLPDTSNGQPATGGLFGMLGQVTSGVTNPSMAAPANPGGMDAGVGGPKKPMAGGSGMPPSQGGPSGRKKRTADGAGAKAPGAKTKKSKQQHHHKQERSPGRDMSPPFGHGPPPMGAPMAPMHPYGPEGHMMMAPHPADAAAMQVGFPPGHPQAPLATVDEVSFFERVKKHVDDRPTYIEFLKLLNLYTQEIIDVRTLVDRAALFIGGHRELFATFKNLCGYEMGKHGWLENEDPIIENVPALQRERVDLSTCKVYGASYRKLPKSEINLACSGRDPMCWEVLNDTWVSHPTWASEGESFNPHRKNVYEDALYRSEEERHEYDYHIEANLRTIALLEPIAARISMMDAEERATFRLKPGLGGQSKSIYQRVIKKVYGREHGLEVIGQLHDNPCVAVPVVLARLKQKDEEWKRAQREWNKVWREVDARNYYKSLDHQGVNFKAADKKAITAKAFVAEVETRRTQQQQRRLAADPSLPRPRPNHQLVYGLDDMQVLTDVLKLAFSFLDRAAYSKADCDRIESLLRTFVPKLLDLDQVQFDEQLNGDVILGNGADDDDMESRADDDARSEATNEDDETDSTSSSAPKRSNKKGAQHQNDLRRKLLRSQAETSGAPVATENRTGSPALVAEVKSAADAAVNATSDSPANLASTEDVEMADASAKEAASTSAAGAEEEVGNTSTASAAADVEVDSANTWTRADSTQAFDSTLGGQRPVEGAATEPAKQRRLNFFCSTPHYVFVRLLQLLYARLHKMKSLAEHMAAQQPPVRRINPVTLELGLQDPASGPAAVVGAAAASSAENHGQSVAVGEEPSGLTLPPSRYYDTLLDLCEKLFDGELDTNTFEESVRYMYGIEGYIVFTLDKVIGALIKAAHAISTDQKSQELQAMMTSDRQSAASSSSSSAASASTDFKSQIAKRMMAEAIVGKDENLYRIEWMASSGTLLIQLLSRDDLTLGDDDGRSQEEKWLYYLASYTLWTPTEGLEGEAKAPFMERSLAKAREVSDAQGTDYYTSNHLEIKVCIATYRLFFVEDTEDVFARLHTKKTRERLARRETRERRARKTKFEEWVEERSKHLDEGLDGSKEQGDGGSDTKQPTAPVAAEGEKAVEHGDAAEDTASAGQA